MPVIEHSDLRRGCERIFLAAGTTPDEARIVSDSLVDSNLLGHDSHGVIRVMQYVRYLREGLIRSGRELSTLTETGSTLLLDGGWNFGQVVLRQAVERCIPKAQANGIVQLAVCHANHIGRLGEYTAQAAGAGLLGFLVANNSGAGQIVAPHGGAESRLATNPISFAAPWKEDFHLVIDMTTSIAPEGKVRVSLNKGESLPEGWILDAQGRPSTNPADLYGPPRGSLFPLGGSMAHKGFSLSLMVEVLGGLISGSGFSRPDADRIANGVYGLVIDPLVFMPAENYRENIRALLDYIKSCPPRPGFEEVLIPGEPEQRARLMRLQHGIPIDVETWRQLTELANELGTEAFETS